MHPRYTFGTRKCYLLGLLLVFAVQLSSAQTTKHQFSTDDQHFLLDGKPLQIISGEIHYPRIPRETWRHSMKMARAMGLNTIGTYVFWNLHEPEKGKFDFSGNNDIAAFVKTAQEEGLWVILRPSPYVCAEWEFGGYPYWLENEKNLVVRSRDSNYLREYRTYIREIGKQLAPLQVNHGGNILMVQVENEYGSYGNDKDYLAVNEAMFREAGFDGLLYTCDPPSALEGGHLKGLLPAVNGIDNPAQVRTLINKYHDGKGPYFIAEWYPAWFDWWGTQHHTVPAEKYAAPLDTVLAAGISINMYMFHGGTTRGFMNGANYNDRDPYEPQISSYDYDAPVNEQGNATEKYMRFREVIQKHLPAGQTLPPVPAVRPTIRFTANIQQSSSFRNYAKAAVKNASPLPFEALHHAYGYVWYRTILPAFSGGMLKINGLRDYAIVLLNGKKIGTLDRRIKTDSLMLEAIPAGAKLDILVENLGRINFGPYLLKNTKGITGDVDLNGKKLSGWTMQPVQFAPGDKVKDALLQAGTPSFLSTSFSLETTGDTWLDMRNWGKGSIWINGHHLGRYWNVGPQQTVYVPAEWLKKGKNEIMVFELLKPDQSSISAIDHPILNELQK